MELAERITVDPKVRGGKPCIRGTRIAVSDILDELSAGVTGGDMLFAFPELEHDDLVAAVDYAQAQLDLNRARINA